VDWIKCITNRLRRAARREAGMTLIEVVFAIAIFGIVSTALIGVLTSATAADGLSREKTIALELAQQQVEYIRQLNYKDVGLADGNPGGVVSGTESKRVVGLWYTLTTTIRYVNDPIPAGYRDTANYKRVRVAVTRASDTKTLASVSTYVSSSNPLATGGLNNALINVTTQDFWTHTVLGGAQIHLAKTWDGSFSAGDTTDPTTGAATFEGLEETPAGATPGYYDVTASLIGYVTLPEDQPPADSTDPNNNGHLSLARGGTTNTTIRLYQPSTITVNVFDTDLDHPFTGQGTVTIASSRGSQAFDLNGTGTISTDSLYGDPVIPGSDYSVNVDTTDNRHAVSTGLTVPLNYPSVLSATFSLTLPAVVIPQYTPVTVTVKKTSCKTGTVQKSATVSIVWPTDPSDPGYNFTGSTNSSGVAGPPSFFTAVPVDTYNITAKYTSGHTTLQGTLANQAVSTTNHTFCVAIS
jgi:prepilin-type N-terminal cleavage/methylation domain-containing protein